MHEGKIVIVDEDHIDWIWLSHKNGKLDTSHKVEMKLIRKKSEKGAPKRNFSPMNENQPQAVLARLP